MTLPKAPTKAQGRSLDMLCQSIRLIEELVPQEQRRFSNQRKRKLEHTYASLQLHADKLNFDLPRLSYIYDPAEYLKHAHLIADALTLWLAPAWRYCEKTTPTLARLLTSAEFEARAGKIQTHEGPAPFNVGDYLACDSLGEYPIRAATIQARYIAISTPDPDGWAQYRCAELRIARQEFRAFTTDQGVIGQAGDYCMRGANGRSWPCTKAKFIAEYRWSDVPTPLTCVKCDAVTDIETHYRYHGCCSQQCDSEIGPIAPLASAQTEVSA